jgi:SAM-dependent methyltransferase
MFQKITRNHIENFIKQYATDKKILDIGSGGSRYHVYFPNRLTVDIDPERKPEIVADAHNLPFEEGEFEQILCTEVLEHVKDPRKVVSELHRVLKSGGLVVLTTRFVFPHHDAPHDYWRYTQFGMRELFKNWDIVELRPETKTFSAMGVLLQRIAFQSKLRGGKITKFFLLTLAEIFNKLNFLTIEEYGDIKKSHVIDNLMPTAYYIAAKKK